MDARDTLQLLDGLDDLVGVDGLEEETGAGLIFQNETRPRFFGPAYMVAK